MHRNEKTYSFPLRRMDAKDGGVGRDGKIDA